MKEVQELTGLKEKTALIHQGLKTLIQHESARRLAALGGSDPKPQRGDVDVLSTNVAYEGRIG